MNSKEHWENIYKAKSSKEVSWFKPHLEKSLELILGLGLSKEAGLIDVGGGASTLPDDLLDKDFKNVTVLDISPEAISVSKSRLGKRAERIHWIAEDVTLWNPSSSCYDLWHDRAVFHFLTKAEDRQKYVENLKKALKQGGCLIIATFGPNGPTKCSGLEIVRYSAESLQKEIGKTFCLEKHLSEIHKTPFDATQEFLYCLFRET